MGTELQKELMRYANELLKLGVPELLIGRFERTAIKRYEEIRSAKSGKENKGVKEK